jgi:aspartyl/glutamyl-tRNA(Asn/Gln) amidotransferase C subunit
MNLEQLGKLVHNDQSFTNILEFVAQVANAKVKTKPTDNMTILGVADLRSDDVCRSFTNREALKNAKRQDGTYYVVPQVVE